MLMIQLSLGAAGTRVPAPAPAAGPGGRPARIRPGRPPVLGSAGQASAEHWPEARPVTVLGRSLSVGAGLLPLHDSEPVMVLPATTTSVALRVRATAPPMVSPAST